MPTIKFYNVKSRKSVEIDVAKVKKVTLKNGRPAAETIDAETGTKTLKCWANYGSPKLWKYRPGPMSLAEKTVFILEDEK